MQKAERERMRESIPSHENSSTKSTESVAAGQKEAATLWIAEKGKPLANAQVELRGILLNHRKRLTALPEFSFVLRRLHSRWLLSFVQKKCTNPL